jgi:hypothetical protein
VSGHVPNPVAPLLMHGRVGGVSSRHRSPMKRKPFVIYDSRWKPAASVLSDIEA